MPPIDRRAFEWTRHQRLDAGRNRRAVPDRLLLHHCLPSVLCTGRAAVPNRFSKTAPL